MPFLKIVVVVALIAVKTLAALRTDRQIAGVELSL